MNVSFPRPTVFHWMAHHFLVPWIKSETGTLIHGGQGETKERGRSLQIDNWQI